MNPLRTSAVLPDVRRIVEPELRSGEKLIWAEQPLPNLYRRQGFGLMIFAIPWTAFSIFWVVGAAGGISHITHPGAFSFFPLFGVPFVLIGVGMLTSPIWLTRKARRTAYAITDQRAIVIEGTLSGGTKVQSFLPDRLTSMTRKERRDGAGDLIFEQFQQRAGSGTTTVRRGFMGVENVREVEELITATLLAGRTRAIE